MRKEALLKLATFKYDTERWLGVDESLQSIHMMAKSALGDMQEARDALKRCSRLANGR